MKSSSVIKSSLLGVSTAALITAPAFACTPKGSIVKYVQDQTTGSQTLDANTVATALTVHPGDTLVYTVTVSNSGGPTSNSVDDMVNTSLTDTLPAGVTPINGTVVIKEDLGTVKEKQSITKTYTVVVDKSDTDGQIITNKACYTGKATNGDVKQDQSGCDVAVVKVSVPSTPTPTPTPTPTTVVVAAQSTPTALPNTGAGDFFVPAGIVSGLGYVGNILRLKRRK